ncbi:FtsX-like permease family protein [Streptomyces shenzhenensis]|uniref:ABC transporter permease n=1 Tax=Streptomyces shenzhenensis TaxID=943815 RepID=UPI0033C0498D
MNFVKRAAYSLAARKGRTAILLAVFFVLCTLVLGGFLLQGATVRQEAEAQRRIGVDATVHGDALTPDAAVRLGTSPLVERYNPVLRGILRAPLLRLVEPNAVRPPSAKPGPYGPGVTGIRESEMLLDFATGRTQLVAGRPITTAEAGRKVVLIEERLAKKNGLAPGDRLTLASPDGTKKRSYEVRGIFRDPAPAPSGWLDPAELAPNQIYAPLDAISGLGLGDRLQEVVLKISSPERARTLHAEARKVIGAAGFRFDVNDKAYRDQVRPLQRVGGFAGALVWLMAAAGTVILGLIVTLTIRERRDELGTLLALGEKKWKLLGQHITEVIVVAVVALAASATTALLLAQPVGEQLLDTASATGELPPPDMRLEQTPIGMTAGLLLGIALVSTVLPGLAILRLHPRSILTRHD